MKNKLLPGIRKLGKFSGRHEVTNIRDDIPEEDFYLHRVPLYMPLHKFVYSNQLYHFMLD